MPKTKEQLTEEQVIAAYEEKWGKDKIRLGNEYPSPRRISTGSLELDYALGGNSDTGLGIPIGRTSRFWGAKSSGKTLNCLNVVANAQKLGIRCAWINAEKTFTAEFAEKRGVATSDLLVIDETIIEALVEFIHANLANRDLFVIDSASNCISHEAKKNGLLSERPMLDAKAWTNALKYLSEAFDHNTHTFIFVDQVRMGSSGNFNFSENPAGGNYMDHFVSIQIKYTLGPWLFRDKWGYLSDKDADKARAVSDISDQLEGAGRVVKARIEKSKVGPPLKTATMWYDYESTDFDVMYEYIKFGKWLDIIAKNGAWYDIPEMGKKSNSEKEVRDFLDQSDYLDRIYNATVGLYNGSV